MSFSTGVHRHPLFFFFLLLLLPLLANWCALIRFTQFLEVWRERREEDKGKREKSGYKLSFFFLASLDVEKQRGWRGE